MNNSIGNSRIELATQNAVTIIEERRNSIIGVRIANFVVSNSPV
jgi:hypothetical protein